MVFWKKQKNLHYSKCPKEIILKELKHVSLDINNCHGLTYAAHVANKYNYLLARIKIVTEAVTFIPWSSQTFNWIGNYDTEIYDFELKCMAFVISWI